MFFGGKEKALLFCKEINKPTKALWFLCGIHIYFPLIWMSSECGPMTQEVTVQFPAHAGVAGTIPP